MAKKKAKKKTAKKKPAKKKAKKKKKQCLVCLVGKAVSAYALTAFLFC